MNNLDCRIKEHRTASTTVVPSGLLRKDGSSKPVYEELLKLIKNEWWMKPTQFLTDQEGKIHFRGFLGEYELIYAGKKISFSLAKKGITTININLSDLL